MRQNEWVLKIGKRTDPDTSIDAKGNIVFGESGLFTALTDKEALAEARARCGAIRCYLITKNKIIAFDAIPKKHFWRTLWKWLKHPIVFVRYFLERNK